MTNPNNTNESAEAGGEDCPAAVSQAAMARTLEAVERQLAELAPLSTRFDELAATVGQLAQVALGIEAATEDRPSKVAPSWLDFDPKGRRRRGPARPARRVGRRGVPALPRRDSGFPECWLWHPEIVEELLWLTPGLAGRLRPRRPGDACWGLARPATPRRHAPDQGLRRRLLPGGAPARHGPAPPRRRGPRRRRDRRGRGVVGHRPRRARTGAHRRADRPGQPSPPATPPRTRR